MRLIDADKLCKEIKKYINLPITDDKENSLGERILDDINYQPTVYAKPAVNHAKWKIDYDEIDEGYYVCCSNCGFDPDAIKGLGKYCPQCGALMNEEELKR